MAFRTKRGRPRRERCAGDDRGTWELQQKRRLQLTQEPLDVLLRRGEINENEHRAGMHFRWLYTLCHGAPLPSAYDPGNASSTTAREDDDLWRAEREADYRAAALILQSSHLLRAVQNCCLYHESPPDAQYCARLKRGLEKLVKYWGFASCAPTTKDRCRS